MTETKKIILILSRRDHLEAMRVAAGMTIFGHQVHLTFMGSALTQQEADSEQAELLELADIIPTTTVKEMSEALEYLSPESLGHKITTSDMVVSI